MRPRQACLGINSKISAHGSSNSSFNEAEASLPRNPPHSPSSKPAPGTCFNEAEASLPRNRRHHQNRRHHINTLQ